MHADVHALQFDPFNSNILYAGTDGGLFKIDLSVSPWAITPLNDSIIAGQLYNVGPHPIGTNSPSTDALTFLAGLQDDGTTLSQPSPTAQPTPALQWNEVDTGDGAFATFDANSPTNAYHDFLTVGGTPQVNYSTSGGAAGSWNLVNNLVLGSNDLGPVPFAPIASDPSVGLSLLLGSFSVYSSTNGMSTWTQQTTQDLTRGCTESNAPACGILDIEYAPSNHQRAYAVTAIPGSWTGNAPGGFYVWTTTHADLSTGATWTEITGNLRNNGKEQSYVMQPASLTVDPKNANRVYLALQNYGINGAATLYKATPNGASTNWAAVDGSAKGVNPIDAPVYKVLVDSTDPTSKHLLAGTAAGLFMSSDGGADWAPYNGGVIPPVPVLDIEQNSAGQVFVATHGAGAYRLAVPTYVGQGAAENECTGGSYCTVRVSAPSGVRNGDVLIVLVYNAGSSSITPLQGWNVLSFANIQGNPTSVTETLEACTNVYVDEYFSMFVHVYNSSDPASYSFTVPRWSTTECGGRWGEPTAFLLSYRGADQNSADYVLNGYIDNTNGTTITAPATTVPGTITLVDIFQGLNTESNEDSGIKATLSAPSGSPTLTAESPLKSLFALLDADAYTGPAGGTFGQYTVRVTGGYSGPSGVFQVLVPPL
jgi:hypothetical protein